MPAKEASRLPGRPKKSTPPDSDHGLETVFSINPTPQTLMWMPLQNDLLPETSNLHREKQRFIRANHHRRRKEQKAQALKNSMQPASPANSQTSLSDNTLKLVLAKDGPQSPIQIVSIPHEPVLCPSIEPQLLDIFPSPKKSTKQDWNIYFNHFRLYTSAFLFPFSGPDRSIWYYSKAQEHPILIEVLSASGALTRAAGLMVKGFSPQAARRCTQDALQLQSQAMTSLQKLLNNPNKASLEVAVAVVATLMYLGVMHSDPCPLPQQRQLPVYSSEQGFEAHSDTLQMHINGLKVIVNLLGGLDNLDRKIQASLYSADCTNAFANNLDLFFEISPVWEAKVHEEIAQLAAKNVHPPPPSPLASNFINSSWFVSLNPRLQTLIHSFKWIILHFEGILHVESQFSENKQDYLILSTYRLLSLHKDTIITPFEDTIRLTMVLYTVTRIWSIAPPQCLAFLLTNLQPSIKRSYGQVQKISPELLFWVLWFGGFASPGLECHEWFVENLVESAVSRGINSWSKASAVLERFFFVHRATDEPGKVFWASIMKHDIFL